MRAFVRVCARARALSCTRGRGPVCPSGRKANGGVQNLPKKLSQLHASVCVHVSFMCIVDHTHRLEHGTPVLVAHVCVASEPAQPPLGV